MKIALHTLITTTVIYLATTAQAQTYKDASAPVCERVSDLLSRMTIDEKIWQLNQAGFGNNRNINNIGEKLKHIPPEIGSLIYTDDDVSLRNAMQKKAIEESRLNIPILFGYDVIHGFRTIYPISLAQACSWNPQLAMEASRIAALESSAAGIDWTFSPMIDVARDPRWGRVAEGYGEDPYTNSVFAEATVKGYQGESLADRGSIAACLKHYIGYGASTAGRDYSCTDISDQTLWDTYMPPYQSGLNAGAATVMSSFNDINGLPSTANHFLLTDILKNRFGFKGFVVSDWNAVEQLISQGIAADRQDAATKALKAGVDMDMGDNVFAENLKKALEKGDISVNDINSATARILELKFRLGLFDNPYTHENPDKDCMVLPTYRKTARQLASESMVMLKNKDNLLPLSSTTKIAVIGPMASDKGNLLGSWCGHGHNDDAISIFEGITSQSANPVNIMLNKGCDFDGDDTSMFSAATEIASKADVILLCLGEKREWSGENASRASMELPNIQTSLLKTLRETGKPIILALTNGRPLILTEVEPQCDAIIEIWQPGIEGGNALADILFGRENPSGKLAMTFPRHTGQIPIFYNERPRARRDQGFYQDIPTEPLYEFTYGLSYTKFKYGEINITQTPDGKRFIASVCVTNNGPMDGYETAHWFISDPVCSITRPIKELKHFEKKFIHKGESMIFTFEIDPQRDLSFVDSHGSTLLEDGEYIVSIKNKTAKIYLSPQ